MARKDNPDRRPLLYGIAALLILVAALFLFWPRGDHENSVMTFTPSTPEGGVQAGHMEIPSDQEEPSGASLPSSDSELAPEDVAAQPILEHGTPSTQDAASTKTVAKRASSSKGSESVGSASSPSSTPTTSTARTSARSTTQTTPTTTNTRTDTASLTRPTSSGRYLLYLGSFSSYANAQKRATELKGKGVPADVAQASKADGTLIYRVRVAYFEGHSRAKAYGDDLKKRLGLGYWIAER